jgi:hypothetical protein
MPNMIVFDKILNLRRKGASINDVQHKIKSWNSTILNEKNFFLNLSFNYFKS